MYAVAEPWVAEALQVPRDDYWLSRELDRIWEAFFRDIPRVNTVEVTFARYWKNRLGLITLVEDSRTSLIGVNAYLKHPEVPDFVHTAIIAHEIAHYAHGFGSPLPRRYQYPHRGGVVVKELARRGLGQAQRAHQQWIHEHWQRICSKSRLMPLRQSSELASHRDADHASY